MAKRTKMEPTTSLAALEEVGEREWRFAELPQESEGRFFELLEAWEGGSISTTVLERKLRALLREAPHFIDVYHHLAMLLNEVGKKEEAHLLWLQGLTVGMQCIIEKFAAGGNKLEWGWLENRPFLRTYHSVGLQYMQNGNFEMALSVFRTILALNPGDNQGVRALAVACCLKLSRFKDALEICESAGGDHMAETVYGRVLALFALKRTATAEKALRDAVASMPLVAQELVKTAHRRPKNLREGSFTIGGADQAWYYWQEAGDLWEQIPGSIDFVREFLKKKG